MSKVTYKEMEALIRARVPFKGNSVTGRVAVNGDYEVLSYSTLIGEFVADRGFRLVLNPKYHSKTTSRIQYMLSNIGKGNMEFKYKPDVDDSRLKALAPWL